MKLEDDYTKARQKAKEAEDTSNLESEVDVFCGRPRRKRYSDSTDTVHC